MASLLRVVLDDVQQLLAAIDRQRDARRVLVVAHGVEHLDAVELARGAQAREQALELLGDHALFI